MNYQKLIMELNKRLSKHYQEVAKHTRKDKEGKLCLDWYKNGMQKAIEVISEIQESEIIDKEGKALAQELRDKYTRG